MAITAAWAQASALNHDQTNTYRPDQKNAYLGDQRPHYRYVEDLQIAPQIEALQPRDQLPEGIYLTQSHQAAGIEGPRVCRVGACVGGS